MDKPQSAVLPSISPVLLALSVVILTYLSTNKLDLNSDRNKYNYTVRDGVIHIDAKRSYCYSTKIDFVLKCFFPL